MPGVIYLYEDPFIIRKISTNWDLYITEYLDVQDRLEEQSLRAVLVKFAVAEGLVIAGETKFVQATVENTGSWEWLINWMNFRALVDMTQYGKLMASLQAADHYPINQLLDLHARIGALFDTKLLNTLANRTMASISLIPYDTDKVDQIVTWEKIHQDTPFIWLIILLQVIIRTDAYRPV